MPPRARRPDVKEYPKPLPARSVILSLLLGGHPQPGTPASLVSVGEYFNIAPATLRAALTRSVSRGELRRVEGGYGLGHSMIARQRRQEEAISSAEVAWTGDWEMAVVVTTGRAGNDRAALRETMTAHRLAELREGVWMRPANLSRPADYRHDPVLSTFRTSPDDDPAALAGTLWDLSGWAAHGSELADRLRGAAAPDLRLAVAADLVRHLATDPILPASLLPEDWPGSSLRASYSTYQHELRCLFQNS